MHNQLHSTFAGLKRIDRRDYPEAALREALLNLIVHREYAFCASSFISVYADRVEFTSIGGLVRGITLSDAMMGISVCRNAKLANVFYRLELIEAYGTGLRKIVEAYAGTGAQPRFETTGNAFKVTLPNLNAPRRGGRRACCFLGRCAGRSAALFGPVAGDVYEKRRGKGAGPQPERQRTAGEKAARGGARHPHWQRKGSALPPRGGRIALSPRLPICWPRLAPGNARGQAL